MMTPDQLDEVVARTGHERFRWLTSDENPDVVQREGYRRVVAEMAEGKAVPITAQSASPAYSLPRTIQVMRSAGRKCFYAGEPACGCSGSHRCHALDRDATLRDCLTCLGAEPLKPITAEF